MKTFPLHIGTPDGLLFEGNVEKVICRTITGDLAILAGHSNFCTALGMGESTVVMEDGIATVTVHITVVYGSKVMPLCEKVQENVKQAIQNMTGITVARVDVLVVGLTDADKTEK